MFTKEDVIAALKTCRDPEIPVNIVDLGLIYDVQIKEENIVDVKMTLTTRGCGMAMYIAQDAKSKIEMLDGIKEANVEIVWEPQWTTAMITPEGRKALGMPAEE
ncbi:metal-sulfur cluster assembly factor [bacterium]|nr:metal-sulfur cluster assembly factor [bacterium]